MPSLFANPYLLTGAGALLIMTHGVAYLQGRSDGASAVQSKYVRATEKTLQAMRRGERAIDDLNEAHARAKNRLDNENRSIRNAATSLLSRPAYAAPCVDADGAGLLDRARAAANSAVDSSEPARDSAGSAGISPR